MLRRLISETVKIASKKEIGGSFKIPFKHWGYATEYVSGVVPRARCNMFVTNREMKGFP